MHSSRGAANSAFELTAASSTLATTTHRDLAEIKANSRCPGFSSFLTTTEHGFAVSMGSCLGLETSGRSGHGATRRP